MVIIKCVLQVVVGFMKHVRIVFLIYMHHAITKLFCNKNMVSFTFMQKVSL